MLPTLQFTMISIAGRRIAGSISVLFVICTQFVALPAENILFVLPIATQSHKNIFDPLMFGLANRGHSINVLSPFPSKNLPANIQEILPVQRGSFKDDFKLNPLEMRAQGSHTKVLFFGTAMDRPCIEAFEHQEVKKLINATPRPHFDVVIIDAYFNQCFWGLAPFFKAPLILLTPMASPLFITKFSGNLHPTSYVPLPYLGLSDRMNFLQRAWNTIGSYWGLYLNDRKDAQNEAMYRKYLGEDTPSVQEIGLNVSLILSNEHHVVSYPRPNLPDTVPVGGIHCREAKEITDKRLQEFLNGAEHGIIFFSLGSILQPDHLPPEIVSMFIRVFSRLKQRVVWKWEDESLQNLPPNVMISKWFPQQDLLGHPIMKLFITHGGLLSTMESTFHGVPLLGIPILLDQDLNMHHAESQGYALKVEILGITEEQFETAIHRLLNEPHFAEKAKQLSLLFRDQMQSPLDRAIFWTEYVIRHKGAPHLRSAARELNLLQTHSFDVLGFLMIALASILYAIYWLIANILRRIMNMCSKTKPKSKKKFE